MSTPTTPYLSVGPYQEVISGISTVFSFSDGVAKLTGPAGAGKTSALRELVRELRNEELEVVQYAAPPRTPDDLQASLIRQFRLGADVSFRKSLLRHFAARPRDQQRLILIFDDAQQFDIVTLQALQGLREIDNSGQPLISVLLSGDKTLNALLNHPELATLQADINLAYTLGPLDEDELSEFCSAWLQQQGKGRVALSLDFLDSLQEQTRGLPEAILQHLAASLEDPLFLVKNARREVETPSEPALLGQVIQNISDQISNIPPETKRWLKPTAAVLFTAAAASTIYTYYLPALMLYQDLVRSQPAPVVTVSEPAPVVPVAEPAPAEAPAIATATPEAEPAAPVVANTATPPTAPTSVPAPAPAATAPVAAPVATAVTPPAPVALPTAQSDTEQVVLEWAEAWRSQDTDAYLGYYHTDFAPLYHPNRSDWRQDRTRSVNRPASIELAVRELAIAGTDATGTSVRFWLDYRSPTYADSTLKELVIGRDLDGELRILRELNREIIKGGAVAAAPVTPPAPPAAERPAITPIGDPIVVSAEPQLSTLQNGRDSINEFVGSWLSAWQHQDVEGYFRHYQSNFVGQAMDSNAQWRSDRAVKITRPAVIQLHLVSIELVEDNPDRPLLRLALDYHSSYYADRTVKEVRLQRRADGSMEIVMERNTRVETLPLARLLPTTSVAYNELERSLAVNRL